MHPEISDWRGYDVIDPEGSKIGTIEDFFVDRATDRPEWALVNMGIFGTKQTLVPFEGSAVDGDQLRVPYEKGVVKDAPTLAPGDTITEDALGDLYRHYRLDEGSLVRDRADSNFATAGAAPMAGGVEPDLAEHDRDAHDELRERQDDLEERQDRLEQREAELESRVDDLAEREAELGDREAQLREHERDLAADSGRDSDAGSDDDRGGGGDRAVVSPAGETRLRRFGE